MTCAVWTCVCGVLGALCCGGGAWFGVRAIDAEAQKVEDQLRRSEAESEMVRAATTLLDDVEDRLRSESTGDLPVTLSEAPPKDPWGTPIRYERVTPDRARLSSAGPDRRFGTRDDVARNLLLK